MIRRRKQLPVPDGWTATDESLHVTCRVLQAVITQQWESLTPIGVPFALKVPGDRVIAHSQFVRREWTAPGDGSYRRTSGGFVVGGRGALTATAVMMSASAVGNSRRRAAAARDAVPRWMDVARGDMYVTPNGFYLGTERGPLWWHWDAVQSVWVMEPGLIQIDGESTSGPVRWQFVTPPAELIFALWAWARHRDHPQFVDGSWLPPRWLDRAAAFGRPVGRLH